MSLRDDPRLTAYALGALDDKERAEVEALLATDPEAAQEVAAIRGLADEVSDALASQPEPVFAGVRQEHVATAARTARKRGKVFSIVVASSAVAATLCGVVVVLGSVRMESRSPAPGVLYAIEPTTEDDLLADLAKRQSRAVGRQTTQDGAVHGDNAKSKVQIVDGSSPFTWEFEEAMEARLEPRLRLGDRSQGIGPPGSGTSGPKDNAFFGIGPDKVIVGESPPVVPTSGFFQPGGVVPPGLREPSDTRSTESYDAVPEEGFKRPTEDPLSTFSIDVDTASYAIVRRFLNEGRLPRPGAVRIEEMVNYFPYAYAPPSGSVPFAVHLEVAQCPWALDRRLVRVGIKGREIDVRERPPSNLVFLLDVSGSMNQPNKLPLVRESMKLLVENLQAADKVSIVVYAGASGLVLPPTGGDRKAEIVAAIDSLQPGGSTNGGAGITLAYATAEQALLRGGNNRVVLCTDGDFNVGVTSQDELVRLVEAKAKTGVFLTVLGFGMDNLKDSTLEKLADKGNGNYGYVDSLREARKVLVEEATGTLFAIAKDVKIQVEFNPSQVAGYRLVGYENRRLAAQDFNDDTKDAGEIGAGHTVTALYEVIPAGAALPGSSVDPLKYQDAPRPPGATSPELLTLKMRWKAPDSDTSDKIEMPLVDAGLPYDRASGEYKFAAAVAAFALILRESAWKGTASFEGVLELASEAVGPDPGGHRAEFLILVETARALAPGR